MALSLRYCEATVAVATRDLKLFELGVVRQLFWGPSFGTLDSAFEFE